MVEDGRNVPREHPGSDLPLGDDRVEVVLVRLVDDDPESPRLLVWSVPEGVSGFPVSRKRLTVRFASHLSLGERTIPVKWG